MKDVPKMPNGRPSPCLGVKPASGLESVLASACTMR